MHAQCAIIATGAYTFKVVRIEEIHGSCTIFCSSENCRKKHSHKSYQSPQSFCHKNNGYQVYNKLQNNNLYHHVLCETVIQKNETNIIPSHSVVGKGARLGNFERAGWGFNPHFGQKDKSEKI